MSRIPEEQFFERVADAAQLPSQGVNAPSKLKAQIYSALMRREAATGPLASFGRVKSAGGRLCVFEELVRIAPVAGEIAEYLPDLSRAGFGRAPGKPSDLLAELSLCEIQRIFLTLSEGLQETPEVLKIFERPLPGWRELVADRV